MVFAGEWVVVVEKEGEWLINGRCVPKPWSLRFALFLVRFGHRPDKAGTMPDDDGFPSTQAIERARPIFFDEAGVPLEVFIDPGAVSNRPKLVRSLRVRFATFFFDVRIAFG